MSGFFENLGLRLGRVAAPAVCKSKWIWDGLTGTEEEALRAEIDFGNALALEMRGATKPANDPELTALVDRVCDRLSGCLRKKRRTYRCEVIRDDSLNATALPGGFIFISHSLVEFCGREAEPLAFVIGHEMAHIVREHAWNRMMKKAASGILGRAVSVVAARAGPLGGLFCQTGMRLLHSAYSQDDEREADEFGFRLAVAAGYPGEAGIHLLQRISEQHPESGELGQYFASHPPAGERKTRMQSLLRKLAR